MESIPSSLESSLLSDLPNLIELSPGFPLKTKLCLFCVEPVSSVADYTVDSSNYNGDVNGLISQSTFLQAIGIFCDFLKVDQRFAKLEQWEVFGVDNFVNFLCCQECAVVLQKLVKLHQLILETKATLKSEIETLANQIVVSSSTTTREYSINTCVEFREEIINNYHVNNDEINTSSRSPSENQPTKGTPNKIPSHGTYSSVSRPMPLSKKRTHSPQQTSTKIHPNIPKVFVKLERLDLSTLSTELDHNPSQTEYFDEGPASPSISITNDPFTEDYNNEDNSDVNYQPTPKSNRRRGNSLRKRGRPPKRKSSKKPDRPSTKSKSTPKSVVESDVDEGDQDYIPPKEDSEDDHEIDLILRKIKQGPGRPLKVGSRLYRSLKEGPNPKPIYILPPSSSFPMPVSPHHNLLMYFNVPFQKSPDSLLCLHPSCTFTCPISGHFTDQTAYSTMRFHIRHMHRVKSSTSSQNHLYFCHFCCTHFDNRLSYLQHRKSLHWATPMPPVLCQVCGTSLPSTSHLLKHLSSHKSPEELSGSTQGGTRRPRKVDPLKPICYPCDQCSKSFKCFTELRIHKKTHIPLEIRRQHQCHLCGERFVNHNTLKGHLDRVHLKTISLELECRYCSRKFFKKERTKYEAHLRTHTGEKPFQCAECGKDFHQKWNLTMHMRLHGEDTVTCEFCMQSFKTKKYLRRHQKKFHPELMPEPNKKETEKYKQLEHREDFIGPKLMFPCEPCQHVYKFKSILVSHLKRMHQMNYEKSEDFPNMWTFEDEGWVVNGPEARPPPPGGWRGRVKKVKNEKN